MGATEKTSASAEEISANQYHSKWRCKACRMFRDHNIIQSSSTKKKNFFLQSHRKDIKHPYQYSWLDNRKVIEPQLTVGQARFHNALPLLYSKDNKPTVTWQELQGDPKPRETQRITHNHYLIKSKT